MKIAWCITGAEMFLEDSIQQIIELGKDNVDLFLSKSAENILSRYKIFEKLEGFTIFKESESSIFVVTRLFSDRYKVIVIAPCSTNTVAKMAYGISDTLITNIFAQAGKLRLPIYVLPSDTKDIMEFQTKSGKRHKLFLRKVDKQNIKKLSTFKGVKVVLNPQILKEKLRGYYENT